MEKVRGNYTEEIIKLCAGVMKAMKNTAGEQLKEYDITFGEFNILMFLSQGVCDTSKDMARHQGYSRSLVSKTVDQLMKRGLLTAQQDSEDRRIMHLKLTKEGGEMVQKTKVLGEKIDEKLRESVSRSDMDMLGDVLSKVRRCLEETR